jgi:hypothetical protein
MISGAIKDIVPAFVILETIDFSRNFEKPKSAILT